MLGHKMLFDYAMCRVRDDLSPPAPASQEASHPLRRHRHDVKRNSEVRPVRR